MSETTHSYLRRLNPGAYEGLSIVHWTHTVADRKCGWLDRDFHCQFRELLIHAGGRYSLWCPAYCLMPDHFHLVWMGVEAGSDQRKGNQWLRRTVSARLKERGFALQKQAYDRVLGEKERDRFPFEKLVGYVMSNPERSRLVASDFAVGNWLYRDSILPGFPDLSWRLGAADYWERFWRAYYFTVRDVK